MPLTIPDTSSASPEAIREIAGVLGVLPAEYVAFLGRHDGARLELNEIEGSEAASIRHFLAAADVVPTARSIDGFLCDALPIAVDDCGNYLVLRHGSAAVYFWDHEVEGEPEKVAEDFADLLRRLRPASAVALEPGQVIRVWVNPDFKPEFD